MNDIQKLTSLIQAFIRAKESGELGDGANYHDIMESYRQWQLKNILDYDKLTHYSDAEFAKKFGEMFDYSDGNASSHSLNRGMHFKTDESRLAIRATFENTVGYIVDPAHDRFELLEEILNPNSPFKVPGLGSHMITTLINAKYPDVPPVNNTTKAFFDNIGDPLPAKLSDAERIVSQFFNDLIKLSNAELNLDDVNHICWYTQNIESGRKFMEQNYAVTFENKVLKRPTKSSHKKLLTHEEQIEEAYAHLKAIHDQAMHAKQN